MAWCAVCGVVGLALLVGGVVRGQSAPADKPPTPLEFWHDGEDPLSDRLADEIDKAFASSVDFIPSSGRKPGSLLMELPANVATKREGRRARVTYTVNFSNAYGHQIGTSSGSCWDHQLDACAEQILKHALIAARGLK